MQKEAVDIVGHLVNIVLHRVVIPQFAGDEHDEPWVCLFAQRSHREIVGCGGRIIRAAFVDEL